MKLRRTFLFKMGFFQEKTMGNVRACLLIIFKNCFFFLKNKNNMKNIENTFGSIFGYGTKTILNFV